MVGHFTQGGGLCGLGLLSCCPYGAPKVRRIGGLEEITSRRRNTGKLKQRAKLGVKYIP